MIDKLRLDSKLNKSYSRRIQEEREVRQTVLMLILYFAMVVGAAIYLYTHSQKGEGSWTKFTDEQSER